MGRTPRGLPEGALEGGEGTDRGRSELPSPTKRFRPDDEERCSPEGEIGSVVKCETRFTIVIPTCSP